MSAEVLASAVGAIVGILVIGGYLIKAIKTLRIAIAKDVALQLNPVARQVEKELTPGDESMKSDLTSLVQRVANMTERVDDMGERMELYDDRFIRLAADHANHVTHVEQEFGDVWSTLRREGILRRGRAGE